MAQVMSDGVVALRALEPTDLDILYAWENDARLWAVTDTVAPFSRQLLWQYLKDYDGDFYRTHQLRLVIENIALGAAVGTVDLMNFSPLNNRAELGMFVATAHQGKGYGRRALGLLCDYAANHLGLRQLYVYVDAGNHPSLAMCESVGFASVGLLKQWVRRGHDYHDAVLMQKLL